jgi:hypothetical protein
MIKSASAIQSLPSFRRYDTVRDIDCNNLKKSFAFLVQRFVPVELRTPWSDPVAALERSEKPQRHGRSVAELASSDWHC